MLFNLNWGKCVLPKYRNPKRKRPTGSGKSKLVFVAVLFTILGAAVGFGLSYFFVVSPLKAELTAVNSQLASTQQSLQPNFEISDFEKMGNNIQFSLQNTGNATATNIQIYVYGGWIPAYTMNVTSVEQGYIGSPEKIATVFNGTITNYTSSNTSPTFDNYVRRLEIPANGSETDGQTYLKLTVQENGVLRYLSGEETNLLTQAFANPTAYYTGNETMIDRLNNAATQTVRIDMTEWADSYEVEVFCDEGVDKSFVLPSL
ncbi:MAG: hypothetical protein QG670_765 [Thermoproteota archaeon]|nr:hypothetical protein [Thermoproteota archaeon]